MSDPYQRDFATPLQAAHRAAGAAATKKALAVRPPVDWESACRRVRAMLKRQYAHGAMEGPELRHKATQRQDGISE